MPLIRKNKGAEAPTVEVEKPVPQLLEELQGDSAELRRLAAIALGARRECTAELAARLAKEPQRAVREAIGSALLLASSDQSAMAIAPLLSSDDATLRNEARELLHLLPNAELVADVLLAAGDPDVRMFALEVLGSRRKELGAARIMQAIAREPDVNVVAHGVEQLGLIGTAAELAAMDALASRFHGEDFLVFSIADARAAIEARTPANSNGQREDA